MNIKLGSFFLAVASMSVLSGCYIFDKLPFKESELTKFSETKFIEELLEIAHKDAPDELRQMLEEISQDTENDPVYVISDNFVLFFEKKETGWYPRIFMKNDSHFMVCEMMIDEEKIEIPAGVNVEHKEEEEFLESEDPFLLGTVSGDEEKMKEFLLNLSSSLPKVCLAIPAVSLDDSFPPTNQLNVPETSVPETED